MRVHVVFAAAVALLAAGCADVGSPESSQRETTVAHSAGGSVGPTTAIPAPSPVRPAPSAVTGAPPAAPASPPRITVRRTGGFVGVEQTLVVRPDGGWAWGGADAGGAPRSGKLTAPQRAELDRLSGLPALAAEAKRKTGPPQCADGFDYTLAVGSLTVSWVDCDPVAPPTAVAITDLLAATTPL
jgi:hypothetical protein